MSRRVLSSEGVWVDIGRQIMPDGAQRTLIANMCIEISIFCEVPDDPSSLRGRPMGTARLGDGGAGESYTDAMSEPETVHDGEGAEPVLRGM
jgi:hypothetical protein